MTISTKWFTERNNQPGEGDLPTIYQDMKKVYIYRVINHNGKKEYKRTKSLNSWCADKEQCWKFSIEGAKGIIETLEKHNRQNYYTYGTEVIDF